MVRGVLPLRPLRPQACRIHVFVLVTNDHARAIGAIVVTIPAAGWLYSQGPKAKPHLGPSTPGHEHADEGESKDDDSEGGDEEKSTDKDEGGDEGDKGDDKEESGGEDSKEDGDGGEDKSDKDTGKKAAQVSTSQKSDKKEGSVGRNETDSDEVKQKDSKVSSAGGEQSDEKANKSSLNFKREVSEVARNPCVAPSGTLVSDMSPFCVRCMLLRQGSVDRVSATMCL